MSLVDSLNTWAKRIKADALTLWFCARHPQTPLPVKILALSLAAYAFSPIDLIPDFIPVLGFLDEVILLRRPLILERKDRDRLDVGRQAAPRELIEAARQRDGAKDDEDARRQRGNAQRDRSG